MDKAIAAQTPCEDWEIDWRLLKLGEKAAAGSCGDLYVNNALIFALPFSCSFP